MEDVPPGQRHPCFPPAVGPMGVFLQMCLSRFWEGGSGGRTAPGGSVAHEAVCALPRCFSRLFLSLTRAGSAAAPARRADELRQPEHRHFLPMLRAERPPADADTAAALRPRALQWASTALAVVTGCGAFTAGAPPPSPAPLPPQCPHARAHRT